MKICYRCKESKPLDDYYKDKSKKDGRTPYCKACRKEKAALQYQKNPTLAKNRAMQRRAELGVRLEIERMGVTMEQFVEMLEAQDFKCAICNQEETMTFRGTTRRLSIDHDHTCCAKKRGLCGECNRELLCARCNQVLGKVNDDIELLEEMIRYLNKWNS